MNTNRTLNDYEIEQIFINWFSLISLNKNLLTALQQEVNYKPNHTDVLMRTPRSVSMSNIVLAAQVCRESVVSTDYSTMIVVVVVVLFPSYQENRLLTIVIVRLLLMSHIRHRHIDLKLVPVHIIVRHRAML